jgi:hypothetical protein
LEQNDQVAKGAKLTGQYAILKWKTRLLIFCWKVKEGLYPPPQFQRPCIQYCVETSVK